MSVTISNCNQICNSPTNTSPSKMLYSFPKTARFHSRRLILCDRYYDMPSTVNGCRTTSLGIGHKYDFTQDAPKNPPPNTYTLKSSFSNTTQGFGFGKGRQEMESTGPLATVKVNKNPGPGSYDIPTTLTKSAYTLTGKPHEQDRERMRLPGPGTYPVAFCINQKGNYFLSKYKNSCVRNFSKIGGRTETHFSKVPGPGAYDSTSHLDLSPQGRYASSKMQNCLTRKFAITTRRPIADRNENPGPGNYQLPSEFGHYLSRKAFQETQNLRRSIKDDEKHKNEKDKQDKVEQVQKAGKTQETQQGA